MKHTPHAVRLPRLGCLFALVALPGACSSPDPEGLRQADTRGLREAEASLTPPAGQERREFPAAFVNGQPVTWDSLRAPMAELGGALALEEAALDILVAQEAARAGVSITRDLVEAERAGLLEELGVGADSSPEQAQAAIDRVRSARGLGASRFDSLLRRTATLRALVKNMVTVTPEMVAQRLAVLRGPRVQARVIVTPTEHAASTVRAALAGEADVRARRMLFADEAFRVSTDESSTRGGLLSPISLAEPAYEAAVLAALRALVDLDPGSLTPVIGVERGFAVFMLEESIPADQTEVTQAARAAVEAQLRTRRERLAMDELARRLIADARISVNDPSLKWSWETSAQP